MKVCSAITFLDRNLLVIKKARTFIDTEIFIFEKL